MFQKVSLIVLFAAFAKSSHAFWMPFHASCKIDWNWPQNDCLFVKTKIIDQIGKWNNTNCSETEKCRYGLVSQNETQVKATHTTPVKLYVDDMTFTFNPGKSSSCQVGGESHSETWYAVLDYGTNFCNLHNLVTGAGLDKAPGYSETTSNSVCTQYSSADCDKY
ncbi:uncharacterized protein LOC143302300 [Babylonia areolata]|uniref:uncharacterized protein LOC143302300 n=1 Tax=Babylonia areolata TaxID=304850 RepID=UPI003FD3ECCF